MCIYDRQNVDQAGQELLVHVLILQHLAHASQERRLVAAVAVDAAIVITSDHVKKLEEEPRFLSRAISPERVPLHYPIPFNDHSQQVIEVAFRVPLDVKVDPCGAGR
jgi:hypothetical protein